MSPMADSGMRHAAHARRAADAQAARGAHSSGPTDSDLLAHDGRLDFRIQPGIRVTAPAARPREPQREALGLAQRGPGRHAGMAYYQREKGMCCCTCVQSKRLRCPFPKQQQMCLLLRESLTVGRIAFSPHFRSIKMEKREAMQRLKDEILNYCVVTEASCHSCTYCSALSQPYRSYCAGTQDHVWQSQNDLHGQALRPPGRPRHRAAAGADWHAEVLAGPQVRLVPPEGLRHAPGAGERPSPLWDLTVQRTSG